MLALSFVMVVSMLMPAVSDMAFAAEQKDTPKLTKVEVADNCICFKELDKYTSGYKDYATMLFSHEDKCSIKVNKTKLDSWDVSALYGLKLKKDAFAEGKNTIIFNVEGYKTKSVIINLSGEEVKIVSQTDGDATAEEPEPEPQAELFNPKKNGEYTVKFKVYTEGTKEESPMFGQAFEKKGKLTVNDGKMRLSMLNISMMDKLLDCTIEKDGKPATSTKSKLGQSKYYEYSFDIEDLTKPQKIGVLVPMMGGHESDKGKNWDKYKHADLEITKVVPEFKGYDTYKPVNIEKAIVKEYGTDVDKDNDGKLSLEEWAEVKGELSLTNSKITDISDLSKLTDKVRKINLDENLITEVPAGVLDNLTGLEEIIFSNNEISDFPKDVFKKNTKLKKVTADGCKFKEIRKDTFAGLKNLKTVEFRWNKLKKVADGAFSDLTALEDVSFHDNELTDLPKDLFSACNKDKFGGVDFSKNKFSRIPVAMNDTNPTYLSAWGNNIADLSNIKFNKFTRLTRLDLHANRISKIAPGTFAKNMLLKSIDLDDNQLRDFSNNILPKGKRYHKLSLSMNNISVLDKAITNRWEKPHKLFPQKMAAKIKVKSGKNSLSYSQDLDILNLRYWYDITYSDSRPEIDSTNDYKGYLEEERGESYKNIDKILESKGHHWTVDTILEKKQKDGNFKAVKIKAIKNTKDSVKDEFKGLEKGTYRIVKVLNQSINSYNNVQKLAELISDEISVDNKAPEKPLTVVKNLKKVKNTYNSSKIAWKKVSGATGYEIYKKYGKKYKKLTTTKSVSYTLKKLKTGKKIYVKVRAYKKSGKKNIYGGYSKVLTIKPSLAKVKGAKARGKVLSWKKVSGASGYQIKLGKKVIKILKASKKSYRVKKRGSYTIRAFRIVDKKKVFGGSAKVKVRR